MNNVSFQGEHGAYSESAAKKFFGKDVKTIPCKSFEDTLKVTEEDNSNYSVLPVENSIEGTSNYSVLPVENSIEGTVGQSIDAITNTSLHSKIRRYQNSIFAPTSIRSM